jgi:GTP cyclohydrolase IA
VDRTAARRAIEDFLRALGHEPAGELAGTPELVASAWCDDLLAGEAQDPAAVLAEGSLPADDPGTLVVLRDLAVTIMCPHHLMPSVGHADVAYLPGDRLVGLGTVSRAVAAVTRRLVLQEQAGARMARVLCEGLGARGALCRLRLVHTCLVARGARESSAMVESVAFAGSFADGGADRQLALGVLGSAGAPAR